jgi:lysophospholipase L1-like esterase
MEATMAKLNKIGKLVKDAWLIIGITVLLLCLLEGIFALAFLLTDRLSGSGRSAADHPVVADTYADPSWVHKYYKEFHRSRAVQWKSYVYWRRRPYRGDHINVDTDGIRRTTVMEARPQGANPAVKIFMFGGSALWGTGARDAFTIPSLLAKALHNQDVDAEIINFGEGGYVSTQEVITLLLRLQQGHLPDLVIFYDGVNDTYSAYQQHVAGLPQNEFNRVQEFNLSKSHQFKQRRAMVLQDVANRLATVRLLRGWSEAESVTTPLPLDHRVSDPGTLARKVLDTYRSNIELVKALSAHYRFKYLFYWQPTIFQKGHLTAYESRKREKMQAIEPFFNQTYDIVRQSQLAEKSTYSFHDLSLVFSDLQAPVYIDWCHLGESGNEIIAKRMAHDVLGLILANKGAAEQGAALAGDSAALHRRR